MTCTVYEAPLLYMQLENYAINHVATLPSQQYSKCYISEK